jgi:YidC/Oxa1 family membrane protein insertase
MDKNSVLGLVLIGAIMIGWMFWMSPSEDVLAKRKQQQDSLIAVQKAEEEKRDAAKHPVKAVVSNIPSGSDTIVLSDSARIALEKQQYGELSGAMRGESKTITLENDVMKVFLSTKGGRVTSVQLKNYKKYGGTSLVLFDADSSHQSIKFNAYSKEFSTDSLFFTSNTEKLTVTGKDSKQLVLRLNAGDNKYLEYVYTISGTEYLMHYTVNLVNLQDVIQSNKNYITLNWGMKTPPQEKNQQMEKMSSTVFFKSSEGEVDELSSTESEKKPIETPLKWVAFKQQFFTTIIIADKFFGKPGDNLEVANTTDSSKYIRELGAQLTIPYSHNPTESFAMQVYFGPTHYQTLKQYDLGLEKQIPLGWGIFGWVNKIIVIPIFNALNSFNWNFGIIILVLTLIIKLLLFPIAYKTYLSSAKMKVLKPEVDELNAKFAKDDPLKKQQAMMALYKKAGVNPMAGCIPMLLQLPILIALFRFFPASIELRQEKFLWAEDLSTYDSIMSLPFEIPFYGSHVSLFALLMTISTILYTYSNSQLMGTSNQMPGMKWMMYLMPVMFLGILNSSSAGLSYYYFLANMITFGQTYLMKLFVDEASLHRKIQENKLKPVKISKFQQRLEEIAKQRQGINQPKRK